MIQATGQPTFVDTHAHLDDGRFDSDVDEVLDSSAKVGVRHIVNIGYRPARWQTSIALAARRPEISFTLGLHPHHADEFSPALLANLSAHIETHRPVALGEIGLDYFRDFADRDAQRTAFRAQIELAAQTHLPVVIHMRGDVEDDLRHELDRAPAELVYVLHSFDGSEGFAAYALDRGFVFGVGGLVTRPANERLREIMRTLPLDRLLLETDAPYLTPSGVKDRRNSPVNIPRIGAELASIKGNSIEEVAAATTLNARRLFNLPIGDAVLADQVR